MFSETPLSGGWTLTADELPQRLLAAPKKSGFSLPGAKALLDFSDLLGEQAPKDAPPPEQDEENSAPFTLPALLPGDIAGSAALSREIDFSALCAGHAFLLLEHIVGSGSVELGDETLLRFDGALAQAQIDLTDALRLGRKQTLTLRFDSAAGAGVCVAPLLRATGSVRFKEIVAQPDPGGRTIDVRFTLVTDRSRSALLCAAAVPSDEKAPSPWRQTRVRLLSGSDNALSLSFSVPAAAFAPGRPFEPAVLKFQLYSLPAEDARRGTLSDAQTLVSGFAGAAPRAYVPLTAQECRMPPEALSAKARELNALSLFAPAPVSALFCRRLADEGIALTAYAPDGTPLCAQVRSLPSVSPAAHADVQAFFPPERALSLWQRCGMPSLPPTKDAGVPAQDLLLNACGCIPDETQPRHAAALRALRALQIRLRAEAARQGQYAGSLCAPGEWNQEECAGALRGALSPLHLSVLPLRGAWWTQSFFSATLCAFIPEEERRGAYSVHAELLDAQGGVLAAFSRDCPACGGTVGIIEGRLPDTACALTLRALLKRSGAVVESQELPVYVGERAPLEAAFFE